MWLTPRVFFSKTKADMHLFPDAARHELSKVISAHDHHH